MTLRSLSTMVLATGLALACGSKGSPPAPLVPPRYLYVGTAGAAIAGYAIDPATGALSALPGSPFATAIEAPYQPTSDGEGLLFCGTAFGNRVEAFQIGAGGGLASLGTTTIHQSPSPTTGSSALSRDGQHLLVSFDEVHVFAIGRGGALAEVDRSPFGASGLFPSGIVQAPSGNVYVANTSAFGGVSAFALDAQGALSALPAQGAPSNAGDGAGLSLLITPDGRYLFKSGYGTGEVAGWRLDGPSGALAPLAGSPWTTPGKAGWMAAISGKFLYASDAAGVAGFAIGEDGTLTALAGSPFTVANPSWPFGLAAEPSGRFVYLTDQGAALVHGFTVGMGGALAEIAGSPWATPAVPGGIAFAR